MGIFGSLFGSGPKKQAADWYEGETGKASGFGIGNRLGATFTGYDPNNPNDPNEPDPDHPINHTTDYLQLSRDVFNLATGKSTSVSELSEIFLLAVNKPRIKAIHKKSIPGVVIHSSTNPKKIKENLHFTPIISLEEGITKLVKSQTSDSKL